MAKLTGGTSVPAVNDVSRIAEETTFKGNLITHSDIRIDGTLEGDIVTLGKLVVGEKGKITGKIICRNADIYGKATGDITASHSASFKSKAVYKGNLKTIHVGIEIGASFSGNCSILTREEAGKIFEGYF
ncbi:MAG: polymer-forming cytoskeletal protein [Bacteroidales bacterium]|jgi:cytoskeletal protein CcmA (bactofilin family)|nr:polymer-forming cytoskeletal protein [Bacteroidales bacterium]MCI1733337.1 polymer-forming cytoskeletal protein [Bacteroidales bacterium]